MLHVLPRPHVKLLLLGYSCPTLYLVPLIDTILSYWTYYMYIHDTELFNLKIASIAR